MVGAMKPDEVVKEVRGICTLVLLITSFLHESEAIQLIFEDVSIMVQIEDGTDLDECLVLIFHK